MKAKVRITVYEVEREIEVTFASGLKGTRMLNAIDKAARAAVADEVSWSLLTITE